MLRDDPAGPGAPGNGPDSGGGAPVAPPTPPALPAAFDPNSLSPEAKAYIAERERLADTKARTTTRDNAAADARKKLLAELTGGDATLTPEQLAQKLAQSDTTTAQLQAENRQLLSRIEVGSAARTAGADEALVTAVLSHGGKLKDLDPAAADFAVKVKTLVDEAIAANPRLKLEATPAVPAAGGRGAVASHGTPNGGEGRTRPSSTAEALAAHYTK
jgi:hypothetical protein